MPGRLLVALFFISPCITTCQHLFSANHAHRVCLCVILFTRIVYHLNLHLCKSTGKYKVTRHLKVMVNSTFITRMYRVKNFSLFSLVSCASRCLVTINHVTWLLVIIYIQRIFAREERHTPQSNTSCTHACTMVHHAHVIMSCFTLFLSNLSLSAEFAFCCQLNEATNYNAFIDPAALKESHLTSCSMYTVQVSSVNNLNNILPPPHHTCVSLSFTHSLKCMSEHLLKICQVLIRGEWVNHLTMEWHLATSLLITICHTDLIICLSLPQRF